VTARRSRWLVLCGLGVIAGAVLPMHAGAQQPTKPDTAGGRRDTLPTRVDSAKARAVHAPTAPDTIRIPLPPKGDTLLGNDSLPARPAAPKPDTIQPPLARPEAPPVLEIGEPRVYDRPALFATGSLTLSDLLGRIPGLTTMATGWLASPTTVAALGDMRRIRVFLDGIELDPLDLRERGTAPVNDLPLYMLEELRIERGADEVRVYATSWRVDRTTSYTRADIGTGDQNTQLYRGYFGRRFDNGAALQFAAQQNSTQPSSRLPSSSAQNLMLRVGTTRGPWSADLFAERGDRTRGLFTGQGNSAEATDTVAGVDNRRTTAYLRLGNGDPEGNRWFQAIASSEQLRGSPNGTTSGIGAVADTTRKPDSTSYESQYLLTGGVRRGNAKASVADRIRVSEHRTSNVPSARASYLRPRLAISLLGEGKSNLDPSRLDGALRLQPLDRLALTVSASKTGAGIFQRVEGYDRANPSIELPNDVLLYDTTDVSTFVLPSRTSYRGEVGVRLRDVWLSAGMIQRGPTTLLPPSALGARYVGTGTIVSEARANARTLGLRGRLWRAVNVDAWAVAWDDSTGLYRPKYQTRSELYIQTNLLDHFPKGNFGLLASLAHEYRSNTRFMTQDSVRVAQGFRDIDFKIEIRIESAVISYQFRNLLQQKFAEVPGFNVARQLQFYGVRWEFWN
jgi:hypothetical protein